MREGMPFDYLLIHFLTVLRPTRNHPDPPCFVLEERSVRCHVRRTQLPRRTWSGPTNIFRFRRPTAVSRPVNLTEFERERIASNQGLISRP